MQASEDALAAIAEAEIIVLGPGSLYTSVLPSLLIPAIRDAVARGAGACDLRLQRRDPARRDRRASTSPTHVEALVAHTEPGLVDVVLANDNFVAATRIADVAAPATARRPPSACAGRRRSSRCRGSSSTTSSTRTTPTTTTRRGWPRRVLRALEREAAGSRRRRRGRTASRTA